jgi:site-specific DNA recombinase
MTARRTQALAPVPEARPAVRCAIYTRKSTNENLDNGFSSLDAQREAGENYIRSQQHEGWVALPERYDDGAFSGATVERPALQRLLADVRAGKIDTLVVYKIDRFSRSLMDFTRLVGDLEQYDVSLVAVTQQFNTTTSMGRLTMNILLSFAQFEREVITERIRDKIAAEKRRGRWVGGVPPLGYDVDREHRRLVVNVDQAAVVRYIFRRFLQLPSVVALVRELEAKGYKTKSWTTQKGKVKDGRPWDKGNIYRLLNNPAYVGLIRHKENTYPGQHEAIIDKTLWDEVQEVLAQNSTARANTTRAKTPSMLRGLIRCGHCGTAMGVTYSTKGKKRYRYYLCVRASKSGYEVCSVRNVPAGDVEEAVLMQLRRVFQAPEVLTEAFRVIRRREEQDRERLTAERCTVEKEIADIKANASRLIHSNLGQTDRSTFVAEEIGQMERQVEDLNRRLHLVNTELDLLEKSPTTEAGLLAELEVLDRIWNELFPAERDRLLHLVVESITVNPNGLVLVLKADGISSVIAELAPESGEPQKDEKPARRKRKGKAPTVTAEDGRITIQIPMKFKRRSGRKEIVLPNGEGKETSAVQESLVAAVARAHRWLALLEDGRFNSVSELAEAVGLDASLVRRHLNLTLLRPDLVRQILDGNEPEGLSLRCLLKGVPMLWDEQTIPPSCG